MYCVQDRIWRLLRCFPRPGSPQPLVRLPSCLLWEVINSWQFTRLISDHWCIILWLILVCLVVMASLFEGYLKRKMSFAFFVWPFSHSKSAFTTMVIYSTHTAIHVYQLKNVRSKFNALEEQVVFVGLKGWRQHRLLCSFSKIRNDPLHSTQSVQTSNILFLISYF